MMRLYDSTMYYLFCACFVFCHYSTLCSHDLFGCISIYRFSLMSLCVQDCSLLLCNAFPLSLTYLL